VKGLLFNELLDFVERHAGSKMLEEVLEEADLASGGAYTAVGNYPHEEAVSIVLKVAERLGASAPELMRQFGRELFPRFVMNYPRFFVGISDSRSFLRGIQTHIHDEVKKLYPDANPPGFDVDENSDCLTITYRSHRPMSMVALGLIEACIEHFGEELAVRSVPETLHYESHARFIIERS
jgi:hypothetical protein